MQGMTIRAVLFDRDQTLTVTDVGVYAEAGEWLAEKYGLEAKAAAKTLARVWLDNAQSWWHLRSDADEEQFWTSYGEILQSELNIPVDELTREFPYERYFKAVVGAREVLTELRGRGLKIGVLSNTLPSIERTLEYAGLLDLVDVPLATCRLGVHKPEARAFQLAAEALGVPVEDILFIDDLPENVAAARALGMKAEQIDLSGQNGDALHSLREVLNHV